MAMRVYLPAMVPSAVTGSVTAWGGGWNALIVAERFRSGDRVVTCDGIGSRLMAASGDRYDPVSLSLNVLAMLVTVAILNRAFWNRLYDAAEARFRLEA